MNTLYLTDIINCIYIYFILKEKKIEVLWYKDGSHKAQGFNYTFPKGSLNRRKVSTCR
jgi:hypothetical protein